MNFYKSSFSLADIFQSRMVLQRNKPIRIWGQAPAGSEIEISLGNNIGKTKANEKGEFSLSLKAMEADIDLTLIAHCDHPECSNIILHSVAIGDIWLAGGQSNMEFFLKYEQDWESIKNLPFNPNIRMYNVPQQAFPGHSSHCKGGYGYWLDASDEGFEKFSAPAYCFARELYPSLNVPIGLVGCNWGGSTASAWVPEEVLKEAPLDNYFKEYERDKAGKSNQQLLEESLKGWAFEDSSQHYKDFEPLLYGRGRDWQLDFMKRNANNPQIPMGPYNLNRPSGLYHNMLEKIIPFTLKGVLWYQGESDSGDRAFYYDRLLTAMIKHWRKVWQDDFPFLLVQLAPFGKWLDCGNDNYHIVRKMQQKVADTIDNVYLTSIMDLGSYYDIHPKNKKEVGRRLALLARGHVYKEENLLCDSPRFSNASYVETACSKKIIICFSYAEGLTLTDTRNSFKVTADGRDYSPQSITIENNAILLELGSDFPSETSSLIVSLGWDDYAEIYIHNKEGLCCSPFNEKVDY